MTESDARDAELVSKWIASFEGRDKKQALERKAENAGITPDEIVKYDGQEIIDRVIEHESNRQFIHAEPIFYTPDLDQLATRPPSLLPGISSWRAALMAAEPGIGKSALALLMCVSVASGEAVGGFTPGSKYGSTCLFISLEEETSEIILRTAAIRKRYGIEVKSNLFVAGLDKVNFLTNDDTIGTFLQHGEQELRDLIYEFGAEFVVLDPLSVWPIGEENNSNHAAFFQVINRICADLFCTIMVIHHTRKPPAGIKYKKSGDDVRGSSSIVGAVRTLMMVNWTNDHIVLHYEKCQYSKPPPDIEFAHSSEVITTNYGKYETLVLTPYRGVEITEDELNEYKNVLRGLFDIEDSYRQSQQSAQWVGYALALHMGIDVGASEKNNANRTKEQKANRTNLTQTISTLERHNLIDAQTQKTKYNNRSQKKVAIYVPGTALYDD